MEAPMKIDAERGIIVPERLLEKPKPPAPPTVKQTPWHSRFTPGEYYVLSGIILIVDEVSDGRIVLKPLRFKPGEKAKVTVERSAR